MEKNLNYYLNLHYPLVIKQDNDGSYLAEYPDLKGCMTCADSITEVSLLAEDAKLAWLETAIENNLNISEPKSDNNYSGSFRIRMPKTLHQLLAEEAKREGISMNQYCIYLLSKECEKSNKSA